MRLPDPIRLALAVASLELLLAGISGGRQAPAEVALALVGALVLGLPGLLPGRPGTMGRWLSPGSLMGGVLIPVLGLTPVALAVWGLVVAAGLVWAAGGDGGRRLSPRGAVAVLLVPYVGAWTIPTVLEDRIPDAGVAGWAAAAAVACLALGHRALPLVLLVTGTAERRESWLAAGPEPSAPDVVLITVDTLRLDEASSMQAFRQAPIRPAQAAAPWTLPSLATLLTGLSPAHHGAVRTPSSMQPLPQEIHTLAERLARAGWHTAATAETPFIDADFGLDQGFVRVRRPWTWHHVLPRGPFGTRTRPFVGTLLAGIGVWPEQPWGAEERGQDAVELLEAAGSRPLFLWVHFFDAHLPYRHAMALDAPLGERMFVAAGTLKRLGDRPGPAVVERLMPARRLELARIDAAMLRIRAAIAERSARRGVEAIVVSTSDHGEEFYEHGGFEHGHAFWQELLAVPLVIEGVAGLPAADVVGAHADVAPTVLGALGLPIEGMDGVNLAGLDGAGARTLGSVNTLYGSLAQRAVRVGDQKLIEVDGVRTAFDLRLDPGEKVPIAASEELARGLPELPDTEGDAAMDPDVAARLRELGYISD